MPKQAKHHVTSVRLDDFQLTALRRISGLEDRSVSFLIGRAIDQMVERELDVSRAAHETHSKRQYEAELLASFVPKPFVIGGGGAPLVTPAPREDPPSLFDEPDPDEVLDARINALLEEHPPPVHDEKPPPAKKLTAGDRRKLNVGSAAFKFKTPKK